MSGSWNERGIRFRGEKRRRGCRLPSFRYLAPIFVVRISSGGGAGGGGGGETVKEGEGRGRKEERKEWAGSIGRDAIPDCEPSETRRRENPDFPFIPFELALQTSRK